jgi:DNA-binding LacI/PurR family transcriptional regulator
MTASLSLRNSPKISAATRGRVRALADKLGYRPDPEISRLMGRLRHSRKTRGSEVIAMIDLRRIAESTLHPYDQLVRRGVTLQADALGFGVTVFKLLDYDGSLERLLRVVRSRGIAGLILLPSSQRPAKLDPRVSWAGLSVVAATTSVLAPRFHQVVPNQLHNMMTMIEAVQAKGYRRLCGIIGETLEERTAHQYSLALTWHGHRERILILPDAATPEHEGLIQKWLKAHGPDLVLAQDGDSMAALLQREKLHRKIAVVSLSNRSDDAMPFQDQMPQLIGESAVRLLTGMMYNHETGVPKHAQVTTVDGLFRDPTVKREAGSPR